MTLSFFIPSLVCPQHQIMIWSVGVIHVLLIFVKKSLKNKEKKKKINLKNDGCFYMNFRRCIIMHKLFLEV